MPGGPKPRFPTGAEKQVLDLMIFGKSNRDIAQVLGKSKLTVKGQVRSIIAKMNVENRTQAVAKYLRPELFEKKG